MNNIEAERSRIGLTKEEMANRLGVCSKTYTGYIRGKAIPSSVLVKMSEIFNCSVDYLLGINNNKTA